MTSKEIVKSDIKILRKILNSRIAINGADVGNKPNVTLKEDGGEDPYEITIEGLPATCFIFKADKGERDELLKSTKGIRCRADYVMILSDGKKKRIVYIELKQSEKSFKELMADVIRQLKGTKCLIEYCKAIASIFWQGEGGNNFLEEYCEQYVFIKCLPEAEKMNVVNPPIKTEKKNNSPDNPKIINVFESLEYNKLVS